MTITVKARVVSVRPRGDDTFGVTLGPGPDIYWLRTARPPKLGELLLVEGAETERYRLPSGGQVTMLQGGDLSVEPDLYARRVVAPQWVERAHRVMRRPLFPFQAEGAGWLAARMASGRGAILADDPGLGKTAQVLAALIVTALTPAIVVCPSNVKRNWARETMHLRPRLKIEVIQGGRGPISSAHLVICNYDILRPREEQLGRLGARCIIFDEAHNLKEPQAGVNHRAAVGTRLAKRIGRPLLLTGTPLLNRPQELWRLLHMIDPRGWPSYPDFKRRYCTSPKQDEKQLRNIVTKHGNAKRLDELQALVMPYMLRRLSKDVLRQQLPPKTRGRVLCELEPFDRQHYDAVTKDVVAWLRKVATNQRAANAARGIQLAKLNMLRRIAAVGKLRKAVREYLEAWFTRQNRPLVIFAYHLQVLNGVHRICTRMGLKIATIRGSDNDRKRQRAVDLFQNGWADVFIAPIKSAGVGLNLQRGSDVLFLERLWTPSLMVQAECRCHRIGQRRAVTVTYLDAVGTVDGHIAAVLEGKQILIDQVVDDRKRQTAQEETTETIDEVVARMVDDTDDESAPPEMLVPAQTETKLRLVASS